jgi:hypothetical protein
MLQLIAGAVVLPLSCFLAEPAIKVVVDLYYR